MVIPGVQFVQEAWGELKKATWLSRKQMVGSTVVVIILVILASIYISTVDFFLNIFLRAFLG